MDLAQYIWNLVEMPGMFLENLTVILIFYTRTERMEGGYERIRIKTNGRKTEKNDMNNILLQHQKSANNWNP